MIYLGADHRGFELKERLKKRLIDAGLTIADLGDDRLVQGDDYVDFALKVAEATASSPDNVGVLICGSGVGMDIVANKIPGIRSALISNERQAREAREDDDANVISLSAEMLDEEEAWKIIKVFLETPFSGEDRHLRRLQKLEQVEAEYEK